MASTVHLPCIYSIEIAHWTTTVHIRSAGTGAVSPARVELLQSFALHLRILLHDLRVSLSQHLSHPFIRHSSITQPRSIGGSKVVDPEIGVARRSVLLQTVLKVAWYPLALRSLGKRNGLSGVIAIWRLKASTANELRGTSAMPFGAFEYGIQTTALEGSTWSLLIGASSL